jgi:hypothetical protein
MVVLILTSFVCVRPVIARGAPPSRPTTKGRPALNATRDDDEAGARKLRKVLEGKEGLQLGLQDSLE